MSYCVHCGVELGSDQKDCPLCGVEVCDPLARTVETAPTYPKLASYELRASARNAAALVAVLLLLIPYLTVLACDLSINGGMVTWSRYVLIFFPLSCSLVLLPLLARKHKGLLAICVNTAVVTGTLYALSELLNGGWFVPFALPICLGIFVILMAALFLHRLLRSRPLTIAGVFFLCAGLFVIFLEYRINDSFYSWRSLSWSFYTLIPCAIIGIVLVIIDFSPSLKKALERRLFL